MNILSLPIKSEGNIVTHDGVFHAHDVFACAMLQGGFDCIIRTRDSEIIEKLGNIDGNIVIDVGEKAEGRFLDHHQYQGYRDLESMFPESVLKCMTPSQIRVLESVARLDCGEHDMDIATTAISSFNPQWDEPRTADSYNIAFKKAMKAATSILATPEVWIEVADNKRRFEESKDHAQCYVLDRIFQTGESGYIVLDYGMPWMETVLKQNQKKYEIDYIVFPDPSNGWRVRIVPTDFNSFDLRTHYDFTGFDGCFFQHRAGFIAGFNTKEQAVKAVEMAVKND